MKCPKCKADIAFLPVSTITPDSEEYNALMQGTLNVCTCEKCGIKFYVSTPLVYSDSANEYFLTLQEMPEDGNTENLENEVDASMTDAAMAQNIVRPTIRLVFSREEFIEKIALHRAGFDDRLVEYAKYQLFQTCGRQIDHEKHHLLFDFSNNDDKIMRFVIFDKESGKHIAAIHIEKEEYEAMRREFENNQNLQKELDAIFPNCHVTVDRVFDF